MSAKLSSSSPGGLALRRRLEGVVALEEEEEEDPPRAGVDDDDEDDVEEDDFEVPRPVWGVLFRLCFFFFGLPALDGVVVLDLLRLDGIAAPEN